MLKIVLKILANVSHGIRQNQGKVKNIQTKVDTSKRYLYIYAFIYIYIYCIVWCTYEVLIQRYVQPLFSIWLWSYLLKTGSLSHSASNISRTKLTCATTSDNDKRILPPHTNVKIHTYGCLFLCPPFLTVDIFPSLSFAVCTRLSLSFLFRLYFVLQHSLSHSPILYYRDTVCRRIAQSHKKRMIQLWNHFMVFKHTAISAMASVWIKNGKRINLKNRNRKLSEIVRSFYPPVLFFH